VTGTTQVSPIGGSITAAISDAVVRITAQYTGRGPTRARTSIRDDTILVLLHDTLTKSERSLLDAGEGDLVMDTRARLQRTMREDLIAAVEILIERKVIAFMSTNHMAPDIGAEIFLLEPVDAR